MVRRAFHVNLGRLSMLLLDLFVRLLFPSRRFNGTRRRVRQNACVVTSFQFRALLHSIIHLYLRNNFDHLLLCSDGLSKSVTHVRVRGRRRRRTSARRCGSCAMVRILGLLLLRRRLIGIMGLLRLLRLINQRNVIRQVLLTCRMTPNLSNPIGIPLIVLHAHLMICRDNGNKSMIIRCHENRLICRYSTFIVLVNLNVVLGLCRLSVRPRSKVCVQLGRFLCFLSVLIHRYGILLIRMIRSVLRFTIGLRVTPILPYLKFFKGSHLRHHIRFVRVKRLRTIFATVTMCLNGAQRCVRLRTNLYLKERVPMDLRREIRYLVQTTKRSMNASRTIVHHCRPVVTVIRF